MIAPILGAAIASGLQLHTQVVQTMQHEVCTLFYKYVVNDGQILKYVLIEILSFSFSLISYSTLWTPETLHLYALNIFCLSLLN